jgi:hypothetical protein
MIELLLLLKGVTEKNQEIQKIVAFADAFPKLLAVIDFEGRSNGGIIFSVTFAVFFFSFYSCVLV